MGCAYGVIGDRLESGMDPFSVLTAIAEASGRMRLATSVVVLPPRGILVASKHVCLAGCPHRRTRHCRRGHGFAVP